MRMLSTGSGSDNAIAGGESGKGTDMSIPGFPTASVKASRANKEQIKRAIFIGDSFEIICVLLLI